MKKIIASAGLIAFGATGVHAAMESGFDAEDGKIWNVSATLRGFYDDNYTTAPKNSSSKRQSYGFEVSPNAAIHFSNEQTDFGAQYDYSLRYYEDREKHKYDQAHQFDLWLKHSFDERFNLTVKDSFVVAQEPELLDPNLSTTRRANGNNINNRGSIVFNAGLTERLAIALGYRNNYYDYKNDGAVETFTFVGFDPDTGDPIFIRGISPSRSGLLDRIEHLANLDLRWKVREQTTALVGYQFGWTDYTGDEPIAVDPTDASQNLMSDVRNNRSHYAYVGADHSMNESWSAAVRLGGRYTDNYNTPDEETSISPYADLLTRYIYSPGSYVELGFHHDRNPTDIVSTKTTGDKVTTDQESSSVYVTLNHKITPKLTGNVIGRYQRSKFNGGSVDGDKDEFFIAGVNLSYRFTHYFSAEVGYNYDRLESNIEPDNRSFTRNRAYVGVTASY